MTNGEVKTVPAKEKPAKTRERPVQVFLSEDEHKILSEKCKNNNMSISYFVRKIITDGEIKNYSLYSLNEIVQELNNIGNDINSIAKKVNELRCVTEKDTENLKIQYERLIEMFLDKLMGIE